MTNLGTLGTILDEPHGTPVALSSSDIPENSWENGLLRDGIPDWTIPRRRPSGSLKYINIYLII